MIPIRCRRRGRVRRTGPSAGDPSRHRRARWCSRCRVQCPRAETRTATRGRRPRGGPPASPAECRWATPDPRVLCLTEITSWGVLYYAYPGPGARITQDTGWSTTTTTAAFSLALVVSAAGGAGGTADGRAGPRLLMTAGSVLGVLAVAGDRLGDLAVVVLRRLGTRRGRHGRDPYTPAFAALTRWRASAGSGAHDAHARRRAGQHGLRARDRSADGAPVLAQTYLVLAAVLAVVTFPAHAIGLAPAWPPARPVTPLLRPMPGRPSRSTRQLSRAAASSCPDRRLHSGGIRLLRRRHQPGAAAARTWLPASTAALALGLGGAGQVAGRLGYARLAAHTGPRTRVVTVLLASALTTALLALLPGTGHSPGAGVDPGRRARVASSPSSRRPPSPNAGASPLRPAQRAALGPATIAGAVAPAAGTALATVLGGYPAMFLVLAVPSLLATALAGAVTPKRAPPSLR